MVGRQPERALGIGQRPGRIAGIAPGGGAQDQDLDIVGPQLLGAVEIGDGPRPGELGGMTEAAIDPEIGILGLEFDGTALRRCSLVGVARLHPGRSGLCPQFGAQSWPVGAHVAGDRLELRGGLDVPAGLEHRHRHAMARAQGARLGHPFLGDGQRPQGIAACERHALGVAAQLVRFFLEHRRALGERGRGEEQQDTGETKPHVEKEARYSDPCKMADRLFILGLGYSGLEIARLAGARGFEVVGTVTTAQKAAQLRAQGFEVLVFDGTQPVAIAASHILCTAPAPRLPAHLGRPRWLGYLSTTGVYGDRGGRWVDEATVPTPMQQRSADRLASELQWQALGHKLGVPTALFRLPGIYGPGRSAIDQVRAGTARRIDKPGQFFSRIHVADIAGTVLAAMTKKAGGIYNVADDEPASTADVVAYACELLGVPVPTAIPWEQAAPAMTPMARSFYSENRRVRNDKIKRELGVVLRYPTYREGLKAIAS